MGATHEQSLPDLLSRLREDSSRLVLGEVELARRNIREELSEGAKRATKAMVSGAVIQIGGILLAAGCAILLGELIPLWAAMLAVGGVICAIGMLVGLRQKAALERLDVPGRRTVQRVKTDYASIQEAVR